MHTPLHWLELAHLVPEHFRVAVHEVPVTLGPHFILHIKHTHVNLNPFLYREQKINKTVGQFFWEFYSTL